MNTINYEALKDELQDISKDFNLDLEIDTASSSRYIYITSSYFEPENLGIFGEVFLGARFTGSISKADVACKLDFCLPISLHWEYLRGGSNGTTCLWATWRWAEEKWSFERVNPVQT